MAETVLELMDACYSYHTRAQTVNAVVHVSHAFEAGLFYAVMGRSGSGKTTLLSLLAGLELPDSGEVLYRGKSTAALDCDAYRRDHAAVTRATTFSRSSRRRRTPRIRCACAARARPRP